MKTLVYAFTLIGAIMFANVQTVSAQEKTTHEWVKAKPAIWKGKIDNKIVSFRIDVDMVVESSADEKKWTVVPKSMWTDFEGNVYRAMNKMLFMSKDGGATWDNAHGATWHGGDGLWYKFDDNWGVWVSQK
jgi:hypothetical protein